MPRNRSSDTSGPVDSIAHFVGARVAPWLIRVILASASVSTTVHAQAVPTDGALCEGVISRNTQAAMRPVAQSQLDAQPNSALGAFLRGCLAMADDKSDKAADFFERATKLEPTRSLYFAWLGRAYGDQAENANKLRQPFLARKTKAAFEQAVQLDPNDLDARNYLVQYYQMAPGFLGGSEDKATEQAEAIRQRNAYRGGFVMSNVKLRRKDVAGAEQEMEKLIRLYPDSVAPWYTLLQQQANAKQWDNAFRSARALHAAHPDVSAGDYALGRLSALSGLELDAGEAALRRYIAAPHSPTDPPLANAHFRLGQVLEKRGMRDAARAELQEAVRLAPNLTEAKAALAALK